MLESAGSELIKVYLNESLTCVLLITLQFLLTVIFLRVPYSEHKSRIISVMREEAILHNPSFLKA